MQFLHLFHIHQIAKLFDERALRVEHGGLDEVEKGPQFIHVILDVKNDVIIV